MRKDRLTDKEDCNSRFAECEGTYSLSTFFPEFALNSVHFLNAIFPSSLNRKTACSSEKLLATYRGHSDTRLMNTILIKIQQFIPKCQNFLSSLNARHPDVLLLTIKTYKWPSKHNRFIMIYYFRATCFDSLESSSGPLTNRPKTI